MTTPTASLPRGSGRYGGVVVSVTQRTIVESGTRQNQTLDTIQRRLQAAGLGLRRSAIVGVRTELRGAVSRTPALNSIRLDFRPGPGTVTKTAMNLRTRFVASGSVRVRNTLSGEIFNSSVRFGYDEPLTRQEILDRFDDISGQSGYQSHEAEGSDLINEPIGASISTVFEGI